eukprot:30173-Chlamydomonas_euryale.AAC.2
MRCSVSACCHLLMRTMPSQYRAPTVEDTLHAIAKSCAHCYAMHAPPCHVPRALLLKEALEEINKIKRSRYEAWRRKTLSRGNSVGRKLRRMFMWTIIPAIITLNVRPLSGVVRCIGQWWRGSQTYSTSITFLTWWPPSWYNVQVGRSGLKVDDIKRHASRVAGGMHRCVKAVAPNKKAELLPEPAPEPAPAPPPPPPLPPKKFGWF